MATGAQREKEESILEQGRSLAFERQPPLDQIYAEEKYSFILYFP